MSGSRCPARRRSSTRWRRGARGPTRHPAGSPPAAAPAHGGGQGGAPNRARGSAGRSRRPLRRALAGRARARRPRDGLPPPVPDSTCDPLRDAVVVDVRLVRGGTVHRGTATPCRKTALAIPVPSSQLRRWNGAGSGGGLAPLDRHHRLGGTHLAPTSLLFVEDDPFVRPAITRALNRTGPFTVTPAEHGNRALEVLEEQSVDAILTDLQMPVMDGLTLLSHLVERGVRVPVAVMTGQQITPEIADRLHRYGIAASFTKPVDLGTLAQELQRAVSPATVGRIAGITLFGFLQLIEVERKTALIVVHSTTTEGRLYFDRGTLVHAEAHRASGLVAVYDILSWPDPKLEIFYERTCRERTVEEPLQHVLMEAARLQDERARPASVTDPAAGAAAVQADLPPAPNARGVLREAMQIQGAQGAAVVDSATGERLGSEGVGTLG